MTLYYVSPYINNYQNRKQTVNHIYIMYMYIITVISFSIYVGRIWTGLKPTSCPDKLTTHEPRSRTTHDPRPTTHNPRTTTQPLTYPRYTTLDPRPTYPRDLAIPS